MCAEGLSKEGEGEGDDDLLPGLARMALELAEDKDAFEAMEVSVPPKVESLQFKE